MTAVTPKSSCALHASSRALPSPSLSLSLPLHTRVLVTGA